MKASTPSDERKKVTLASFEAGLGHDMCHLQPPKISIPGHESLVAIRDIPRLLPPRPNGKRLHISAPYRWITRGVRGVRLEVVRVGGSTYTSQEALARFTAALSSTDLSRSPPAVISRQRLKQIEEAADRVKALVGEGKRGRPKAPDRTPLAAPN